MKVNAPERLHLPDESSDSDEIDVLEEAILDLLAEEDNFMAPFVPNDDRPIFYVQPPPPPPTTRPSPEVPTQEPNEPLQQAVQPGRQPNEEPEWSTDESALSEEQSATSSQEQSALDLSTQAGPSQSYQPPTTAANHQEGNSPATAQPSRVVSEAEMLDLNKPIECPFSDYLKHNYHEVPMGNLLVHMTQCPMGQQQSFCEHCFKHAPIYVLVSHVLVCPENPNPAQFFTSESD
jgi:hypothetical protein